MAWPNGSGVIGFASFGNAFAKAPPVFWDRLEPRHGGVIARVAEAGRADEGQDHSDGRERDRRQGASRDLDPPYFWLLVWSSAAFKPRASVATSSVAQKCM